MKIHSLLTCSIMSTAVLFGTNALADDAATIEGLSSGTGVTYGDPGAYPVITAILSQEEAVSDAHTYTSTSLLAADSTGSLDIFNLTTAILGSYTPAVGDAISVSGTYSPFHQIPEIGTVTSISLQSSGNPAPLTLVATIPQLNVSILPQNIAGFLIEIDNVTISGGGSFSSIFPTYNGGNVSYTITDSSNNNMVLYDWVTSYSTAAALGGQVVPTGPVNIIGFDSVFTSGSTSTAEFTPIAIVAAPEPTTLGLCGVAGLLALSLRSRKKA